MLVTVVLIAAWLTAMGGLIWFLTRPARRQTQSEFQRADDAQRQSDFDPAEAAEEARQTITKYWRPT